MLMPCKGQHACGTYRVRAEPPIRDQDERLRIALKGDIRGALPGDLRVLLLRGGDDKIGARGSHTADGETKTDRQGGRCGGSAMSHQRGRCGYRSTMTAAASGESRTWGSKGYIISQQWTPTSAIKLSRIVRMGSAPWAGNTVSPSWSGPTCAKACSIVLALATKADSSSVPSSLRNAITLCAMAAASTRWCDRRGRRSGRGALGV